MELLLTVILSVAPPVAFLVWILRYDRIEPEPLLFILRIMFFGALTVIPAALIEGLFLSLPLFQGEGLAAAALQSFLVIAPVEETVKLLAVFLFVWKSRNFNEPNDGIVYAGTVSIGFAMAENLFYVFENGLGIGIARALTAIPGHTFTGVIMGYFLGRARFASRQSLRNRSIASALLLPWVLHGAYDTFVLSGTAAALLVIPMVVLNFVLGIRYLKKGRASSAAQWGASPAEVAVSHRRPKTWKKVTARILLAVSGLFWLLVILGLLAGTDDAADILAGTVILTVIPVTAGILLEISGRKG